MITNTEENYLKAIYSLNVDRNGKELGTNELASHLGISPATASSMLKKLKDKEYIHYEKYGAISLLEKGEKAAYIVIRKHRLWETFLVEKLEFTWDEIHEVAEQLEHIKSKKLVDQLDKLLGYPQYDPHGDPIPDSNGEIRGMHETTLIQEKIGKKLKVVGVKHDSQSFLKHITRLGLIINSKVTIKSQHEFDGSLDVEIDGSYHLITRQVAENIYVSNITAE
ncbi:MAG: metal-dependent transcriptional regulator [Cyclobacteriaceae bacterium]|jgi:DtxR family Mn-dependent transcriptional regulator|tara:strand:+ start:329 stop:997 length:669 start_codon:yes stop_codon:yes gene_type:complete